MKKSFDPAVFDLSVPGVDNRHIKMPDLLRAFHSATIRDPETALKMGRAMEISRYIPGQLAYARFLRTAIGVSMPRSERHRAAERILLRLNRDLEIPSQLEAEIALELAELYGATRPVGCLAALLRANRLGITIPAARIERCRKAVLESVDVNQLGSNPHDAYQLAAELEKLGNAAQLTELFYRLAFEDAADKSLLKGNAALSLAEFYSRYDEKAAATYSLIAQKCGFPDLVI